MNKYQLALAGEMRVTAELLKKGYNATITFGNAKATDIIVMGEGHCFIRVEVKTSGNQRNFVTGYYPKYTEPNARAPDVWIFYLPDRNANSDGDRFFLLTHEEAGRLQLVSNKGVKTEKGKGCDNIPLRLLEEHKQAFEGNWDLIGRVLLGCSYLKNDNGGNGDWDTG